MKLTHHISLLSTIFALGVFASACSDTPDALTGGRSGPGGGPNGEPGGPGSEDPNAAPGALECTVKPEGRAYKHFDGTNLADSRLNENVGVNRARLKPFTVMSGEYSRVLGTAPASLAASAGSFDDAPPRWFEEAQHSGVSLNAVFDISFEGCSALTKAGAEYAAAPTNESAATVCKSLIRKAWSRSASPDEITACSTLAVTKLATEADARKRWAYVCASVLSSSQFLTF